MKSHAEYQWGENAQLAIDTMAMRPTRGIGHWMIHVMEIAELEHFTGRSAGDYLADPDGVYMEFQRAFNVSFIDQYLARNPLSMQADGFGHGASRTATTGAEHIALNGIVIDSPEAVVEHLERIVWPRCREQIAQSEADAADTVAKLIAGEREMQARLGNDVLKSPYAGFYDFPKLRYGAYGYVNYFMTTALYPEVIARDFALQADLATLKNRIAALAIVEGGLPAVVRLDHDMADSRGMLMRIDQLDRDWFPQFARCIQPLLDANVRLIWHCDGNLMQMVPRLIEAGVSGFQGFQYEDGMDYERICRMTDRDGGPLMIWGGVSVTRTLPLGTPQQVRDEIDWLVRHAPPVGFFLGGSSSITPGVPRANLEALREGLDHYRVHGRG